MQYNTDIAVIGGGAAGLMAAITAKRKAPNLSVTLIEGLDRVGKKLITTGNGRCNITNKSLSLSHFHGEDKEFCRYALSRFGYDEARSFFESIGVDFVAEGNRVYPASLQAASVVDALRFECDRLGVSTHLSCKIKEIKKGAEFTLLSDSDKFSAKTVIIASGLFSGGEKIGSDGSIFRLLKDMGISSVKATPSLVQLKTETDFVKQLKGIKVVAKATLLCGGKALAENTDEVLFCDYGLSGPAILQISRDSARDDRKYEVSLDLYPEKSANELTNQLIKRAELLRERSLEDFFTGMLNKRLGQVLLKYCGFKLSDSVFGLSETDFEKIAKALKDFRFKITSNTGFLNSQVTAGGLKTSEFDSETMMSKKIKGLFAAGEILDIDGDCGGFNLAFAWASGHLAAESAVDYL
jgi:predicted Rossmann fold flavoprotein